jgi:DNA-binding MarR family transcriptional regulator
VTAVDLDRAPSLAAPADVESPWRAPVAAPRSPADLQELVHLLSVVEHRVSRRVRGVLAGEGTSVAQWHVLFLLADGIGHSMTELAEYALLPAATVTRLVEGMVRDGLVRRIVDAQDRRRVLVHVTAAGRARQRALAQRLEQRQSEIIGRADAALLQRLTDRLTAHG